MKISLLATISLFLLLVVFKSSSFAAPDRKVYIKVDTHSSSDDLVIQPVIWKAFEKAYPELTMAPSSPAGGEGGEGKEGKEKKEAQKKEPKKEGKKDGKNPEELSEEEELLKHRPALDFVPFHVLLEEKTDGVLGSQNYQIQYGPGGGGLDYSSYIPEKKGGTFFLRVKFDGPFDWKEAKIFYLSGAPVAQLDGESIGSGCKKYFDISRYWKKTMKSSGLMLNTVSLRHLMVTAGTFFFISPRGNKLSFGRLAVTDRRHKDLLCKAEAL